MRRKGLLSLLTLMVCLVATLQVYSNPTDSAFLTSVMYNANQHYLPGDLVEVTLHGENNGVATFDVGNEAKGLPMSEVKPGVYVGSYLLPKERVITDAEIVGHLQKGERNESKSAPVLLSSGPISDAVTILSPNNGSTVTLDPPTILFKHENFFQYDKIDFSSLPSFRVYLDEKDVTLQSTITEDYARIVLSSPIPLGRHHVKLLGKNTIGQTFQSEMWFTVGREASAAPQTQQ